MRWLNIIFLWYKEVSTASQRKKDAELTEKSVVYLKACNSLAVLVDLIKYNVFPQWTLVHRGGLILSLNTWISSEGDL